MQTLQVLIIVVVAVGAATALKCYKCEGKTIATSKGDCGDTFNEAESEHLIQECNATMEERYCRKEKAGVNYILTDVKRLCVKHCEISTNSLKNVQCCETDLCNAATVVTASILSIAAMVTAMKYLFC